MPSINTWTLSQYSDIVNRVFEKKKELFPMVLKNSPLVQKVTKQLGTWDSIDLQKKLIWIYMQNIELNEINLLLL